MFNSELLKGDLPVVSEYDRSFENAELSAVMEEAYNVNPAAIYELADRARAGRTVEENQLQSMELYKEVLYYQNHLGAFYWIGYDYITGVAGEENRAQCIPYFEAAVELGDADSAMWLGDTYYFEDFTEHDYDKALEYYFFASEHGREDAYYFIAGIHKERELYEDAVKYYMLAMDAHEYAALQLGWLYENGLGVEASEEKAVEYYKIAQEKGVEAAAEQLERIANKPRSLKELAVEDKDPDAMAVYFKELMDDKENGGVGKAEEFITEAYELYPEHPGINQAYAFCLFSKGKIVSDIAGGGDKTCMEYYDRSLKAVRFLKGITYNPDYVKKLESDIQFQRGKYFFLSNDEQSALESFKLVDLREHPMAAVYTAMIHMAGVDRYAVFMEADVASLERVINYTTWEKDDDKAMAYLELSLCYVNGIGVAKNVEYAYEYIKMAAALDRELARDELSKYTKGMFGVVRYKEKE